MESLQFERKLLGFNFWYFCETFFLANLVLSDETVTLLSQHQVGLNSLPIYEQHQDSVIKKHDRVIKEYREVYKKIMAPVWNNYGRVMNMGSEFLLDENGERIYKLTIDDQGREKKKYVEDPTTSIYDNKGFSLLRSENNFIFGKI